MRIVHLQPPAPNARRGVTPKRSRFALAALVMAALGCGAVNLSSASSAVWRVSVRHGLAVHIPDGWHVTYRHFTPCSDPVERFTLVRGDQALMVQERIDPVADELRGKPRRFSVRGAPTPMTCCSIDGRRGWTLQFSDRGRAFYAYLYPGREGPEPLLAILDTLRVT